MKLTFRLHAIQKMFERQISAGDVRWVIENGEIIREYPDDTPYPSRLMLGWIVERPLHVVVADVPADGETIVITAYEPDPALWEADFKRKKGQSS
jgi:hypothetical protein